jgi:hypothetical protein
MTAPVASPAPNFALRFPRGRATSRAAWATTRSAREEPSTRIVHPEEHNRVVGPNPGTNVSFPALRIMFLFYRTEPG